MNTFNNDQPVTDHDYDCLWLGCQFSHSFFSKDFGKMDDFKKSSNVF
jgi:hypothetical protein